MPTVFEGAESDDGKGCHLDEANVADAEDDQMWTVGTGELTA